MADHPSKDDAQPSRDDVQPCMDNEQLGTEWQQDEFWRDKLTPEQYYVCREKGTERPFTGEYWQTTAPGQYLCRCCHTPLFEAGTKFDAGCGWPSFYQPATDEVIREERDLSHGMIRTEVMCQRCGSHLGHVFPDGPAPTGLRYCINSASVLLEPEPPQGDESPS